MTSTKCKIQIENYALSIIQEMMGTRQRGIGLVMSRAFNDLKSHLEHHPDWRRVRDDMGLKTYAEWEAIHATKCQAEREAAQAAEHQAKHAAQDAERARRRLEKEAIKEERAVQLLEARKRYSLSALALHKDLGVLHRIHDCLLSNVGKDHRFRHVPLPASWPDGTASAYLILKETDAVAKSRSSSVGLVDQAFNTVTAMRAELCEYVEALYETGSPEEPLNFSDIWHAMREHSWSNGDRPRHPSDDAESNGPLGLWSWQ